MNAAVVASRRSTATQDGNRAEHQHLEKSFSRTPARGGKFDFANCANRGMVNLMADMEATQ
jgi:hypothetical protein